MHVPGTLVYDGEIALPIVSVVMQDGQIIFRAQQYFAGTVTLASGPHDLRIYGPDQSLVFQTTVTFNESTTVTGKRMTVSQPITIK